MTSTRNSLPLLVNIMELSTKLSSNQLLLLYNKFIKTFSGITLMKIIFEGLYLSKNKNKNKWISFINDTMIEIIPKQYKNLLPTLCVVRFSNVTF